VETWGKGGIVLFVNFCLFFYFVWSFEMFVLHFYQQIAQVRGTSKNTLKGSTTLKPRMATVNGNAIQWQIAPVYSSEGDPKFGPTFSHNKKKSLVFFLVFTDLPQLWSLFKF
jgi:hypothetical protein